MDAPDCLGHFQQKAAIEGLEPDDRFERSAPIAVSP
jgi:hypothetical protein